MKTLKTQTSIKQTINDIGGEIVKDSGNYKINISKDSVMNGLSFYDSVFGSGKKNETYSLFSQAPIIKECFVDA